MRNIKAEREKIDTYVMSRIDGSGYGLPNLNDAQKIEFLLDAFKGEYNQTEFLQRPFTDWMKGLPSSFNVDFENYRIIELCKEFGVIPQNATEKQENIVLKYWWAHIYMAVKRLARKHKIQF